MKTILDVRKGERLKTFLMFSYFFIIIASYWFLKPVRSALTVEKLGADSIRELKVVTALVSALVVMAYSIVVTRFSRTRLTYLVLGTFFWLLVFFSVSFHFFGSLKILYYSFYVFLDLFITVNLALFWTFMADISSTDSSKRLYGLIGVGGVIGGFIGSFTCNQVVELVGPSMMMFGVLISYSLLFFIVWGVTHKMKRLGQPDNEPVVKAGQSKIREALEGARQVMASKYFIAICIVMASYEFVSTVNDFSFHKAVELTFNEMGNALSVMGVFVNWLGHFLSIDLASIINSTVGIELGKGTIKTFFSEFYLLQNILALLVQLVVTPVILRRLGMGAALLVLPGILLACSLGFLLVPLLLTAEILLLCDNAFNYSINQTSREMLFVPVPRKDKFKTLAFIDMFVLRSAKALAGFALVLLPLMFDIERIEDLRWYMMITITIALFWSLVAVYLGRKYHKVSDLASKAESEELG